ncbi:hypothetical protein MCOR01_011810 [Pyricularia oryzae]|nr:hypothetical protein MCOR01_011810 [Pyricularia oryzae]
MSDVKIARMVAPHDKDAWKAKAKSKRASILAAIPREWILTPEELNQVSPPRRRDIVQYARQEFLTAEERDITEMDAVAIVNAVRSRSLTAEKVTRAFCKAAAIAHQIVSLFLWCLALGLLFSFFLLESTGTLVALHGAMYC